MQTIRVKGYHPDLLEQEFIFELDMNNLKLLTSNAYILSCSSLPADYPKDDRWAFVLSTGLYLKGKELFLEDMTETGYVLNLFNDGIYKFVRIYESYKNGFVLKRSDRKKGHSIYYSEVALKSNMSIAGNKNDFIFKEKAL